MQYFFGLRIDEYTQQTLVEEIKTRVKSTFKCPFVVANHNFHSLYLCLKDKSLSEWINSQGIVHADGMGIIYLGWLLGAKLVRSNRITYMDLTPDVLTMAQENNFKVFYLGTNQVSLEKGISKIHSLYTDLKISSHNGYFLTSQNQEVLKEINDFQTDILFVGMGMPRQELWIKDNIDKLDCKVILISGAVMDLIAGSVKTPPRWAGKIGLEWAFRLCYYPKQLWKRYLLEPVYILYRLLVELLRELK